MTCEGKARHGMEIKGIAWKVNARHDMSRHGKSRNIMTWKGKA